MRWGMTIDLTSCVGCYACVVACDMEHFSPRGISWLDLAPWEDQKHPALSGGTFQLRCNHCAKAPCVSVCPTRATQRRPDGIVWTDQGKCVGCNYCVVACPYQRQKFVDEIKDQFPNQGPTDFERIGREVYPHQVGTAEKCNFCKERIDSGLRNGKTPGIDREATPACVVTCQARALTFGDLDDPISPVANLVAQERSQRLHPDWGTDPSVYHIRRDPEPSAAEAADPKVDKSLQLRQRAWIDGRGIILWLAFFVGGLGGGLYLASVWLDSLSGIAASWLIVLLLKSSLHLAYLRKPLRAWRMLAGWRTSWISRGLLAIFFFLIFCGGHIGFFLWAHGSFGELAFKVIASVCAVVVATYSGFVLYAVRGIPFWNSPLLPLLFLLGSLASGFAAALAIALGGGDIGVDQAVSAGKWLIVVNAGALTIYLLSAARNEAGRRSASELLVGPQAATFWIAVVLLGMVVPLASSFGAQVAKGEVRTLLSVAAATELIGGLAFRFVVLKAGIYRRLLPM